MAYDLLEHKGNDLREQTTVQRRAELETLFQDDHALPPLRLSPLLAPTKWQTLEKLIATSRDRGVEGVMLKHRDAPYGTGRQTGLWWKRKVDPYTIDAVMTAAQPGHGRRAGLLTDYTFSIWQAGELTPFTKAYSGLSNDQIEQVDQWIRKHTVAKHGPVRIVEPELVFEIAFEGLAHSTRHRSGIALRFPRITRWRQDKPAAEADKIEALQALLAAQEARLGAQR
jgi:DNA ligase-1